MELSHILAFNAALLVALISPGPAMLYAIRTALSRGRGSGVAAGVGLGAMAALWTLAALLGLDALFRLFPWAYAAFKALGALYLIFIAWGAWRSANDPVAADAQPVSKSFRGGFLVNLANPKSALFAAAVLVVIFPSSLSVGDKAFIVANHFLVECVAYGGIACAMTTEAVSMRYLRAKPVFDRIAAAILGALGLRLLLDRS